jgi:two-component system response regulator AtoC
MSNTNRIISRPEAELRVVTSNSQECRNWRYEIERLIGQIAPSDMPVLIQGETGAGKEVIARRIHENSKRCSMPFIKINCAALPSELIESELFGYEKGAFTGAMKTTPGKFALADRGTVFLDEIGDMDFKLQGKLLQVLQDREYIPLGAREAQKVDVRIVAATHRDIKGDIVRGTFREDLYYRLDVINIYVPALRHRRDEILPIAEVLLEKHRLAEDAPQIPACLAQALLEYEWPGNVRELENVIKRFIVFRDPQAIIQNIFGRSDQKAESAPRSYGLALGAPNNVVELPSDQPKSLSLAGDVLTELRRSRDSEETDFILRVLDSARWNRKKAAVLLKMEYKTLLYRMKKLGIDGQRATGT